MKNLDKFKEIADESMKDIYVTRELKDKTLARVRNRRSNYNQIGKILVAAACLILIIGLGNLNSMLPTGDQTEEDISPETNKLFQMEQDLGPLSLDDDLAKTQDMETFEAEEPLRTGIDEPTDIPEGFELDNIKAYGSSEENPTMVELIYVSGDDRFSVMISYEGFARPLGDYKEIDINGFNAFLSTNGITELYLNAETVQYFITGSISEEEAIELAKNLIK